MLYENMCFTFSECKYYLHLCMHHIDFFYVIPKPLPRHHVAPHLPKLPEHHPVNEVAHQPTNQRHHPGRCITIGMDETKNEKVKTKTVYDKTCCLIVECLVAHQRWETRPGWNSKNRKIRCKWNPKPAPETFGN